MRSFQGNILCRIGWVITIFTLDLLRDISKRDSYCPVTMNNSYRIRENHSDGYIIIDFRPDYQGFILVIHRLATRQWWRLSQNRRFYNARLVWLSGVLPDKISDYTDDDEINDGFHIVFAERSSSVIAGWRGGWIERNGSEGSRPALLFAGPVPERWNVKLVFIETPHVPAISWTGLLALFDVAEATC